MIKKIAIVLVFMFGGAAILQSLSSRRKNKDREAIEFYKATKNYKLTLKLYPNSKKTLIKTYGNEFRP
jgi:hypothetical protein